MLAVEVDATDHLINGRHQHLTPLDREFEQGVDLAVDVVGQLGEVDAFQSRAVYEDLGIDHHHRGGQIR